MAKKMRLNTIPKKKTIRAIPILPDERQQLFQQISEAVEFGLMDKMGAILGIAPT